MSILSGLLGTPTRQNAYTMTDYINWVAAAGWPLLNTTYSPTEERIETDFPGMVRTVYQANGIVFACLAARFLLFSTARFQYQQLRGGQPGDLFGTPELRIVEDPEPGRGTPDLLAMALTDADLSGDWFGVRRPGRIKRLRPDWSTIIVGSPNKATDYPGDDPDAEIVGYSYSPQGRMDEIFSFGATEVAHFAPIQDPVMKYRGMPLVTAALREIGADSSATTHKGKFFSNAATPNLVVKFPATLDPKKSGPIIEAFEQDHTGAFNAYRTLYLLGGADVEAVGKDLQQLDFRATQGAGETRIAAVLNVHPVIAGTSEGLQGSALNAGNFGAARRLHADKMLRPAWANFAKSLETIVPPLAGTRLWYDERSIPFLREDVKDAAEVLQKESAMIVSLGNAGWDQDAVVDAITSGDLRRLRGQHTGLMSVQLQPPGSMAPDQAPAMAPRMAARITFTPSAGTMAGFLINRGDVFDRHDQVVARYPSLFEPLAAEPVVSKITWPQLEPAVPTVPLLNGGH